MEPTTGKNNSYPSPACRLCGGGLVVACEGHWGYQAPAKYDIHYCPDCDTSVASPLVEEPALYDFIYSRIDSIPGYHRYREYADNVLKTADPLAYLAQREDGYWAVWRYLEEKEKCGRLRVLEVGCGFGYLTYAIAKRGHDVTGIDASCEAIEGATRRYGNYYRHASLETFGPRGDQKFDLVVLTEMIEHVIDVPRFLGQLSGLLADGGEILVTTPNKTVYPETVLWDTDPPPIHFWWFSESSMRAVAGRIGYAVRFLDFSPGGSPVAARSLRPTKPQVLDEAGRVRYWDSLPLRLLKGLMQRSFRFRTWVNRTYVFSLLIRKSFGESRQKRLFLCAIFRPAPKRAKP